MMQEISGRFPLVTKKSPISARDEINPQRHQDWHGHPTTGQAGSSLKGQGCRDLNTKTPSQGVIKEFQVRSFYEMKT